MELNVDDFIETVRTEEIMFLATAAGDEVSVRPVSPLMGEGNVVYFYTSKDSRKYRQMKENPVAAFVIGAAGRYQAEGTVRFLGSVFSEENEELNGQYRAKYRGAFEEAAPGEDMESNEFIAFDLKTLKGWIFDTENPEIPIGKGELTFA
ncbi:pyridoxamine 5'-phosphate oxidase family protein [Raoultibacter phocaeensis]|uniref:pyridoxamine 5'-phosphate oxidase family protein n=1 Tax=Raoultibacter phocaeensis TaxID=2479841 RepID=UPI00111AB570|nr:pyridoxamine 5'-phosphate oxidase family protein [Raoultibacter phocaeensis]